MERALAKKYSEKLKKVSIPGVEGWTWDRELLLEFLNDKEECKNYVFFGGDVMKIDNGVMSFTYDNWYVSRRRVLEKFEDYAKRSIETAIDYVRKYPDVPNIVFNVCISSEITAGL